MKEYNKVDISKVSKRRLPSGDYIPAIGLGTFGSDRFSADEVASAVYDAIKRGYRHIDCAPIYRNEKEIGKSLRRLFREGIKREELWVTSKVWNDMHGKVREACEKTLMDLGLDYLDLYLVHWPFPNSHPVGAEPGFRNPNARPYIHSEFMDTWSQMERLVEEGLVRNIGTSNMTIKKLDLLLKDARVVPVANEMELHPHFQQPELFEYCMKNKIQPIGFCPIGSPTRPDRDKTPEDTVDIEDPTIVSIAKSHNIHPAVVCVKWAYQRGQIPIPFSVRRSEYMANLIAVTGDPLTDEEMAAIEKIDKNCRLIKGQVFLWPGAKSWKELWDED